MNLNCSNEEEWDMKAEMQEKKQGINKCEECEKFHHL